MKIKKAIYIMKVASFQKSRPALQNVRCHISYISYTRLVLDLIDYKEEIESGAIILFLDFYKAFNRAPSPYKAFGFPFNCINVVQMLYKDINSCNFKSTNITKVIFFAV